LNTEPNESQSAEDNGMTAAVRQQRERQREWMREGEPSMAQYVGRIGVLGWIIVAPTLIGLFIGRWLDQRFGTGIFWSAPLMGIGVIIGCWSAWKWMHKQ
jgi:ATP synthase protein I